MGKGNCLLTWTLFQQRLGISMFVRGDKWFLLLCWFVFPSSIKLSLSQPRFLEWDGESGRECLHGCLAAGWSQPTTSRNTFFNPFPSISWLSKKNSKRSGVITLALSLVRSGNNQCLIELSFLLIYFSSPHILSRIVISTLKTAKEKPAWSADSQISKWLPV